MSHIPTQIANITKTDNTECWKSMRELILSHSADRNAKL